MERRRRRRRRLVRLRGAAASDERTTDMRPLRGLDEAIQSPSSPPTTDARPPPRLPSLTTGKPEEALTEIEGLGFERTPVGPAAQPAQPPLSMQAWLLRALLPHQCGDTLLTLDRQVVQPASQPRA